MTIKSGTTYVIELKCLDENEFSHQNSSRYLRKLVLH